LARPPLKERLIGTLVILCLGLIFYPLLFNSKTEFEISRDSVIPVQRVQVDPLNIVDPSAPFEVQEIALHELFNPNEDTDQIDIDDISEGILNESGLPQAWVIQLGSFALTDNAESLKDELITEGYDAYVRLTPSFNEAPDLYKVYVGPVIDPSEARRTFNQLSSQTGNEAILLKFEP
jgi:DedD protein